MALRKLVNNQPLTWVDISTDNLSANIENFKKIAPNKKLIAVIKSNAYGHDMNKMASCLDDNNALSYFATADLAEALALRYMGIKKPIMVLSIYDHLAIDKLKLAIQHTIDLPIYHMDQIKYLEQASQELSQKVNVHIKIDIGTHRLGLQSNNLLKVCSKISNSKYLNVVGIFSHFADSENKNNSFTRQQEDEFFTKLDDLKKLFNTNPIVHIACSASTMTQVASSADAVRLGISLYGLLPSKFAYNDAQGKNKNFKLKPILSWHTTIIAIQKVKSGDYIGYARGYRATKDMTTATLPVGYWDGYDRGLSNKGKVIINNKIAPVVGKICMNLMMVDISDIESAKIGDRATLLGNSKDQVITADDLAYDCDTINYEVVTRINQNVLRKYI